MPRLNGLQWCGAFRVRCVAFRERDDRTAVEWAAGGGAFRVHYVNFRERNDRTTVEWTAGGVGLSVFG